MLKYCSEILNIDHTWHLSEDYRTKQNKMNNKLINENASKLFILIFPHQNTKLLYLFFIFAHQNHDYDQLCCSVRRTELTFHSGKISISWSSFFDWLEPAVIFAYMTVLSIKFVPGRLFTVPRTWPRPLVRS